MSELPKFVLQRLASSAVPAEHPGADLLAAFAEQGLSATERERLLVHLAGCDQCRAVVWHALPESAAEQAVAVRAPSRGWAWSSAWRWVGVAAGIVVIAGVAVLFRGGPGPAGEKAAAPLPAPVVAQRQETAVPEVKQPASSPSAESRLQASNAPAKAVAGTPAKAVTGTRFDKQAAAGSEGGVGGGVVARNEPLKESPVNAKAARNQMGGVDALAKSSDEIALKDEERASAAPAPAPLASAANAGSAAKTVPASTAVAGVMIASNINARDIGKKKLAPPTRWMLSPHGALLRSTDSGNNWQTVPFAGNTVFHAVAVVGPNVWVGGQGGALYYSSDDGTRWQRLTPSADDAAALAQDITALTFSDAQHGSLTTSAGQTWTTSDGGRSWQKR